jgi:hypothetical protein
MKIPTFYIFQPPKRIVSEETMRGNTVVFNLQKVTYIQGIDNLYINNISSNCFFQTFFAFKKENEGKLFLI